MKPEDDGLFLIGIHGPAVLNRRSPSGTAKDDPKRLLVKRKVHGMVDVDSFERDMPFLVHHKANDDCALDVLLDGLIGIRHVFLKIVQPGFRSAAEFRFDLDLGKRFITGGVLFDSGRI